MGKDLKGRELGKGLRQKPDGIYIGRYTDRFGKRRELRNQSLTELRQELKIQIENDKNGKNIIRSNMKLDEWYEKWRESYKKGEIKESSILVYDNVYRNHISPIIGNFLLHEITNFHIRKVINTMRDEKGLSYEMQNKAKVVLVDMFNKTMLNHLVNENPAKGISLKRKKKKDVRVLTREEQFDFFECAAGTFYYNAFVVQVQSGLRPGELYGLIEDDLDFENNSINVNRTLIYQKLEGDAKKEFHINTPKTEQSRRTVPMTKECKAALLRQLMQKRVIMRKTVKDIPEHLRNFIFTTRTGMPINAQNYREAIEKIVDEINFVRPTVDQIERFTGHCFRHTFATRCFESGIDFKVIQKYLGHASLQMTMDLYVHVVKATSDTSIPKLENLLDEINCMDEQLLIERFDKYRKEEKERCKILKLPTKTG